MGVFQGVSSYPWSDASCSEFQNIHCHQATECFETIINPWVRMTYHSRCTSSSQSCHHLLSPWLWWNSWWGFFWLGVESRKHNSSRSQQGWAKKVSRTAVGYPESCECPRTLLWPRLTWKVGEVLWGFVVSVQIKSVLKVELCLWCSLASPEFFAKFFSQDLSYRPLALMFGLLCPGVKFGDLAWALLLTADGFF